MIQIQLFSFSFSDLMFEKAYCQYRLNKVPESLKTLRNITEPDDKVKELLGQVVSGYHVNYLASNLFVICCLLKKVFLFMILHLDILQ